MKRALTLNVGAYRLCVDSELVLSTGQTRLEYSDILADWQKIRKQQPAEMEASLLFLTELLNTDKDRLPVKQRLVAICENNVLIGLVVSDAGEDIDFTEHALVPTPSAFSDQCRRYFPQLAITDVEALLMLTPASVLRIAEREGPSGQKAVPSAAENGLPAR